MEAIAESINIIDFGEKSFLDYSMYSIANRSLPRLFDGLKPVHRRVLYAMHELRLNASAKYKKSARTVGDTLGKYHPHGDSACYEAMVLMAQSFNTLYPLVDGQGNWGSPDDPKSFAAMRYTEAKMTPYAESFFEEIRQDTVTFTSNFDGTDKEPTLLPARVPNVLINGTSGIAVGVATDVPSHNMQEVVDACVTHLKKTNASDDDILSHITVPDYPGGAVVISSQQEVHDIYRTGRGTLMVRADIEVLERGLHVKSLPPKISTSKIIEDIDDLVREEKLPVSRVIDRSDENTPVSIFIDIDSKGKCELVKRVLLAKTKLEMSCRVNMMLLGLEGKPKQFTLPEIIRDWCTFRQVMFERKKNFRLSQVKARLHILDGLLIAYEHLDEVIRIIREEDDPQGTLMAQFGLSDEQARAILDLRLRHLAKLEEGALRQEHCELAAERDQLEQLLADDKAIKRELIRELTTFAKAVAQPRRTRHEPQDRASLAAVSAELEKAYPVTVVLSKMGWVRALRGHDVDTSKMAFKAGDALRCVVQTQSRSPVILMGDKGRIFNLDVSALPGGKSVGEPVSKHCQFQNGEMPLTLMPYIEGKHVLLVSDQGNGFITSMETLLTRAKKGKHVMVCKSGISPLVPTIVDDNVTRIAFTTHEGRLLIINRSEINVSDKSMGVKLVSLGADPDNHITSIQTMQDDSTFSVMVGKRKLTMSPDKWDKYCTARARRGLFFDGGRKQLELLDG